MVSQSYALELKERTNYELKNSLQMQDSEYPKLLMLQINNTILIFGYLGKLRCREFFSFFSL